MSLLRAQTARLAAELRGRGRSSALGADLQLPGGTQRAAAQPGCTRSNFWAQGGKGFVGHSLGFAFAVESCQVLRLADQLQV